MEAFIVFAFAITFSSLNFLLQLGDASALPGILIYYRQIPVDLLESTEQVEGRMIVHSPIALLVEDLLHLQNKFQTGGSPMEDSSMLKSMERVYEIYRKLRRK